jgi:RNA polymerase sigma-B factor
MTLIEHCTDAQEIRRLQDEVVLLNKCVADALAARYRDRGVALEDLQQAASEGLIKAVRRFDPSLHHDLLTYAVPTIRGELQRHFRDHSWTVRPPRRIQELQFQITRAVGMLAQDQGREPLPGDIADFLGVDEAEVLQALQASGCFQPASLDRPAAESSDTTLGDLLPDSEEDLEASEARVSLAPVVRALAERDRRILYLRFFEDCTQEEIGQRIGVSQMQVSRLLNRILGDLRQQLT